MIHLPCQRPCWPRSLAFELPSCLQGRLFFLPTRRPFLFFSMTSTTRSFFYFPESSAASDVFFLQHSLTIPQPLFLFTFFLFLLGAGQPDSFSDSMLAWRWTDRQKASLLAWSMDVLDGREFNDKRCMNNDKLSICLASPFLQSYALFDLFSASIRTLKLRTQSSTNSH